MYSPPRPPRPFSLPVDSHEGGSSASFQTADVEANRIPTLHNIFAAVYAWSTLAGYVLFPSTFTPDSFRNVIESEREIMRKSVRNSSILIAAFVLYLAGHLGPSYLWLRQRKNYVWLITHIFL